jgi:O-succinylbenzoic acid--CoA ligase
VRAVLLGGDAASGTLLADAARRGVPALTTYGLTEACSQVATQAPGSAPSLDAGVGPPLRGVEVRIVGGEIQVRGPNLMTGYHPSDRWPSPFLEGGWLPTGDLGELDAEGRLHVRGRRSDLIITGGENVDPREVEGVLREHAGVADACVFGVADERWGQIVAAALIPADPLAPPELVDVARHAAERLAKYKRPRAYAIAASLVLNATSKLDRKKTASAVLESLVALVALEGRARGE